MTNKLFAERLNKELDAIDVPAQNLERIEAFAKLVKIPKFKAEAFLNGVYVPDPVLLEQIAEVLEVKGDWLIGKAEKK